MNYKTLIVIALALCLCVSPALAVGKFYENKIVPYNMTEEFAALPQNLYGTLQVHLRCSDNFLTPEIGIRNQIEPNGTFRFFPILPDGTFEMQLIPGRYDLFLKDGNGGQSEHSTALITAGMTSYPERELLGHAYAGSPEPEPEVSPAPDCHTHRIWIFGHFGYYETHPHWRWIPGHWYTWECCRQHCEHTNPN